jgi:hypothetical protein
MLQLRTDFAYTFITHILQQEVDEWAQKIEKAGVLVPEYKPVGWLKP